MMSYFKENLRKVWNALAFGNHQPGRFFVHKKKFYVLERHYDSLLFSSRSVRQTVLDGILSVHKQAPVIMGLLAGAVAIVAGTMADSFAVPFTGLMFFVLTPYLIAQVFTGGDEGSIPVLLTGPHKETSEYAGQKAGKIAEILPHLTKDQVVEMVESLEKQEKIEDLIHEAEGFLKSTPDSCLIDDVESQLDRLKSQLKDLEDSQRNGEVMRILREKTAAIENEKVIEFLQKTSECTSTVPESSVEVLAELQNTGNSVAEEVGVFADGDLTRVRV